MNLRKWHVIGLTIAALFLATGSRIRAQEQKPFSPALEQLRETVSERLQTVADQLGLTPEERTKIREAHAAYADKFEALRTQRRELLQSELEAIRDVLTPEQRDRVKGLVEDRREMREAGARRDWPEVSPLRDSLAERVQAAAEEFALTPEQRQKIRDIHAPFAEKYRSNRAERRNLVEAELKAIAEGLTPEQREKARRSIEGRMAHATVAQSVAERLRPHRTCAARRARRVRRDGVDDQPLGPLFDGSLIAPSKLAPESGCALPQQGSALFASHCDDDPLVIQEAIAERWVGAA